MDQDRIKKLTNSLASIRAKADQVEASAKLLLDFLSGGDPKKEGDVLEAIGKECESIPKNDLPLRTIYCLAQYGIVNLILKDAEAQMLEIAMAE